jgi:hypothetical protein
VIALELDPVDVIAEEALDASQERRENHQAEFVDEVGRQLSASSFDSVCR